MKIFLSILLVVLAMPAYSCTCTTASIRESYRVPIIFYGRHIETITSQYYNIWSEPREIEQFTVETFFKGLDSSYVDAVRKGSKRDYIISLASTRKNSCGLRFTPDNYYLVYAYFNSEGQLETTACARTRPIKNNNFNAPDLDNKDERAELIALQQENKQNSDPLSPALNALRPVEFYRHEIEIREKRNEQYRAVLRVYQYIVLVISSILAARIVKAFRRKKSIAS